MATDSRQRLIEAARRLFHEQGYHATGVATILREADVRSGSLYHAFPGKEALLAAVLDHYHDALLDACVMGPAEAAEADPVERVFTLLENYRRGLDASECRMGCPIGNLALEVSDSHPELRPSIRRNFDAWAARVAGWLEEAGNRLPPGCDRGSLARHVLAAMEGGIMLSRASGDLAPFDEAVRNLRDYFSLLLDRGSAAAAGSRSNHP